MFRQKTIYWKPMAKYTKYNDPVEGGFNTKSFKPRVYVGTRSRVRFSIPQISVSTFRNQTYSDTTSNSSLSTGVRDIIRSQIFTSHPYYTSDTRDYFDRLYETKRTYKKE